MSLEIKLIALLALVAGLVAGYAAWTHKIRSEATATCEARHDAADSAALRSNLLAQAEAVRESARMDARLRDVSSGLPPLIHRVFVAADCPEPSFSPPAPAGSAPTAPQPDLRPYVQREIEDRLAGLALEADIRGRRGSVCEFLYPVK